MDSVSALGLASAILTFIDFSTKVLRGAKKIHDTQSDALEENATSELVVNHMQRFSAELSISDPSNSTLTGNDAKLCELASECKKIADELITLLEGLKRTDPKSWTQAVRVAWKNETHRGRKDELNKRLESCRSQFQLQLNYYTSKETMTRLSALLERSKDNDIQVQKLQECVIRLQETLQASVLDETAKRQVEELLRFPKETVASIVQERILRAIRFSEIDQRFNDIRPAHSETFNWLFSDERSTSEDLLLAEHSANDDYEYDEEQEARGRNRQLFARWLSSGSGVFHFSAKLGAGKSTLMKEACNHDAVKAKLREWAGTRELLLGQFFFWRAGTPYQKTLNGMFRGLLYDVLRSKPELIPLILPSHWDEAISTPWQANKIIEITNEVIEASLEHLVSEAANGGSLRLFFFIDGLDEMEKNTTHTYQDLVATISKWVIESSGNVKVCASSREYFVFLNSFPESQRLHLHHLTKLDMQRYVRTKLGSTPNAKDMSRISNNIVRKSQGIFFWVALVTTEIRQQMNDGASMDELLNQIDGLPDDLYEFYGRVLKSLERPIRKIAYETFAMMEKGLSWRTPVLAIGYAFFKDWKKSRNQDGFMTHLITEDETIDLMLERSRREVRRYCKGLVEISEDCDFSTLAFAHRSVRDFLLEPSTAKVIETFNADFDVSAALSQILILADYVCQRENHSMRQQARGSRITEAFAGRSASRSYMLYGALSMREEAKLDTEPYGLLRSMDAAHWAIVEEYWNRDRSMAGMVTVAAAPFLFVPSKHWKLIGVTPWYSCVGSETYPAILVNSPMMMLTQFGSPDYAVWRVRNCPSLKKDNLRISLLIYCALSFHLGHHYGFYPSLIDGPFWRPCTGPDIIGALLNEGLVSPNFSMQCALQPLRNEAPDNESLPSLLQMVFMVAIMILGEQDIGWAGSIIEALLQHPAALDFTISTVPKPDELLKVYITQTDMKTGKRTKLASVSPVLMLHLNPERKYSWKRFRWGPERIVEESAFENKDRILSLIRRQRGQTGHLLEETSPPNLESEENPPVLLEEESPKNVTLSDAAGTWGWLILLLVGMVLGTVFSKLFAF